MRKISVLTFLITAFALGVFAQQGRIDAGIQVKPIFSSPILRTGPIDMVEGDTRFTVTPRSGYVLGGVFRVGLWKNTAIESGLSVAQRHYRLSIENGPFIFAPFRVYYSKYPDNDTLSGAIWVTREELSPLGYSRAQFIDSANFPKKF